MKFRQVHLDFHTSEKIPGIGEKFSKEQFQMALKLGHVDSITVFSKCHHGWAYHPSTANEMHPHLKFDLLGAQIEAAHEIGVKTPVYISAGLDEKMARRHSGWLIRKKDESTTWVTDFTQPGYHRFCFNTPYLDYLLEQIREVCQNYDADGIFLDIVGVIPCYCQSCVQTLRDEGKDPYDEKNAMDLAERVYANYTKRVRETIDSVKPGLPVFHNGGHIRCGRRDLAFMDSHLELESLPTGGWGYDHFPLSAAYVRTLGMEYLGMTGKFHLSWGEFGGFKHDNALRYETALNAALGAKSSVGDQLHPSGEMDMATYELIGSAYSELEKKEPWLDHVQFLADIAVLSTEAVTNYYPSDASAASTRNFPSDIGCARILLEGKYQFDVVDTQQPLDGYKVVILPDRIRLDDFLKEKLAQFVQRGGKLLASGTSGLSLHQDSFAFDFGCSFEGESEYSPTYLRPNFPLKSLHPSAYVIYSSAYRTAQTSGQELAACESPYFNRTAEHFCSHQHAPDSGQHYGCGISQGKDGIYLAWNLFEEYCNIGSLIAKETVCHVLDTLLGEGKTLSTTLPAQGVATVADQPQEKRLVLHLLYASPVKRGSGVEVIEDILPVYHTKVTLHTDKSVRQVTLVPQMQPITFSKEGNNVSFEVEKLENHQMVCLDYE